MAITVDVFSDLICPWCYIGKRRLEKGIGLLGRGEPVSVRWHPFQLNPDMPPEGKDRKEYRSAKFGSWERSQAMDADVTRAGRGEGITFDYEKVARTPNTLDSHRLVWLAGERGVQGAVVEALFKAYFTDGRDMNDRATLAEVAAGAGLDRAEVDALLAGDAGLDAVRAGEREGRRLGVTGVPFVVINGSVAISGAQTPETFRAALEQAAGAVPAGEPAGVCGIDPASGKRTC
ncbi:MAG: DsbA family oxidoreductase [Gemmataceae bacterium]|nr:DsbA family oxidoreductase [Gemmataceae bacterium]